MTQYHEEAVENKFDDLLSLLTNATQEIKTKLDEQTKILEELLDYIKRSQ